MALVIIGGTEYEVPELNFAALERAWPFVMEAMITLDPLAGVAAGIKIIAAGLIEAEHFDRTKFDIKETEMLGDDQTFDRVVKFLKRKMKAKEIADIRKAVDVINKEAGLEPITGEEGESLLQQVRESLLTGTAQTSQPSSSPPDTKEEAGA